MQYEIHAKTHSGWVTLTAEGASFAEAAITGVAQLMKDRHLDLDAIPHAAEFFDADGYPRVKFFEASARPVTTFGFRPATTKPGEWWFSVRVQEGKAGDCGKCGGTGRDFHNPFEPCWNCKGHSRTEAA